MRLVIKNVIIWLDLPSFDEASKQAVGSSSVRLRILQSSTRQQIKMFPDFMEPKSWPRIKKSLLPGYMLILLSSTSDFALN